MADFRVLGNAARAIKLQNGHTANSPTNTPNIVPEAVFWRATILSDLCKSVESR